MSRGCCCGSITPTGPTKEETFFYALQNMIETQIAVAMKQQQSNATTYVSTPCAIPSGMDFAYPAINGANDRLRLAINELFKEDSK